MISIERLQAYLRHSARLQYEEVCVPGFSLFFHPTDALVYFNYAIPDNVDQAARATSLAALREGFAARNRRPRVEYVEAYAGQLAPALLGSGFAEEARQQLMVCTAESYRPAPEVPGLRIEELTGASPAHDAGTFLTTQRRGFGGQEMAEATGEEAQTFLGMLGEGRGFVGWLAGKAAGAGMVTTPSDGITEVVGLATLERFRNRGIGTALAARAVQSALAEGVDTVCLMAADARAGRVYERVGFVSYTTMLAYVDGAP